jgi:hypothetical protein
LRASEANGVQVVVLIAYEERRRKELARGGWEVL